MKNFLLFVLKLICMIWGLLFYFASICGLILCFTDHINPLILNLSMTIFFFCIGSFLFYVALKKMNMHNNIHLSESTQMNNYSNKVPPMQHIQIDDHESDQNTSFQNSSDVNDTLIQFSNNNSTAQINEHIEPANTICHTIENPIADEEVANLIQLGFENAFESERQSINPKFHRTAQEENLSYNFVTKYGAKINLLSEKFETLYRNAYKTDNLLERINLLEEAVQAFEIAKTFCYSKGTGGTIYFQDMWEHMHNSNNNDFSYLDNIQNSLEETKYLEYEVIPSIINTIVENNGILQKNIYKLLPDIDKTTLQLTIKLMESNNMISRTKTGNSYQLQILP